MADYGRTERGEPRRDGVLVVGVMLYFYGVSLALPIYAAAGARRLVWTTIAVAGPPRAPGGPRAARSVGAVFRAAPRFWGFLLATLLVWTGFNGAWNFVGLKIRDALLIGLGTALGGFTEVGVIALVPPASAAGAPEVYALGCFVYATGFFLWGVVANRTIVSLLAVFEGAGFSLLFTTSILVVGKLLRPRCTRAATRSARWWIRDRPDPGRGDRRHRLRRAGFADALRRVGGPRRRRWRRGAAGRSGRRRSTRRWRRCRPSPRSAARAGPDRGRSDLRFAAERSP